MSKDKRILYTRPDGGVSIVAPAPGVLMTRVMKDIPKDATNIVVVDAASIPADRTFRDAWKQEGKRCVEDIDKCKALCHNHRRAVRDAEFAPLDREATIPTMAKDAEAKRAAVRAKHADVQSRIDAATTPDELKVVIAGL